MREWWYADRADQPLEKVLKGPFPTREEAEVVQRIFHTDTPFPVYPWSGCDPHLRKAIRSIGKAPPDDDGK